MGVLETGWGLQLILWFQSWRTPLIEGIGQVFHFAGSEDFYMLVVPFVYWCVDAAFGRRLAALFMFSMWGNSALKMGFKTPRPFFVSDQVNNVVLEKGYGLPSGHAQGTTTLWGTIAVGARRWWVTLLVALFIVLMALSRMILGVHYLQDVVVGMVVSLILVGLYAWLEPKVSPWIGRQGLWTQIGLVIVVTALMLIIHPVLIQPSAHPWVGEIPLDELLAGPLTAVGVFFGMGIGFALVVRYAPFDAGGDWWRRALRLILGLLGVMALRFGLGALFEGLEPAAVFRLVRYGLIGVWAGFGAPWLFLKIGIASPPADTGELDV